MNANYVSDEIMIFDSARTLIAHVIINRIGRAFEATLFPLTLEGDAYFRGLSMTRRNAIEKFALRDVLAYAMCNDRPVWGRMLAHDIATRHGLTLESCFIGSTLADEHDCKGKGNYYTGDCRECGSNTWQ